MVKKNEKKRKENNYEERKKTTRREIITRREGGVLGFQKRGARWRFRRERKCYLFALGLRGREGVDCRGGGGLVFRKGEEPVPATKGSPQEWRAENN